MRGTTLKHRRGKKEMKQDQKAYNFATEWRNMI